jgi:hypothetical protein
MSAKCQQVTSSRGAHDYSETTDRLDVLLKNNGQYGLGRRSDNALSLGVSGDDHPTLGNPEPSRSLLTVAELFRMPAT